MTRRQRAGRSRLAVTVAIAAVLAGCSGAEEAGDTAAEQATEAERDTASGAVGDEGGGDGGGEPTCTARGACSPEP